MSEHNVHAGINGRYNGMIAHGIVVSWPPSMSIQPTPVYSCPNAQPSIKRGRVSQCATENFAINKHSLIVLSNENEKNTKIFVSFDFHRRSITTKNKDCQKLRGRNISKYMVTEKRK